MTCSTSAPASDEVRQLRQCHPLLRSPDRAIPSATRPSSRSSISSAVTTRTGSSKPPWTRTVRTREPHPPRVDYALYMRGLSYFSGEHSWYHRLNANLADRPPRNVQESFSAFSQLVQRFPNSVYAADAQQRMVFPTRNRLGEYENRVARYYLARRLGSGAEPRGRGDPVRRRRPVESLAIMTENLRAARHARPCRRHEAGADRELSAPPFPPPQGRKTLVPALVRRCRDSTVSADSRR